MICLFPSVPIIVNDYILEQTTSHCSLWMWPHEKPAGSKSLFCATSCYPQPQGRRPTNRVRGDHNPSPLWGGQGEVQGRLGSHWAGEDRSISGGGGGGAANHNCAGLAAVKQTDWDLRTCNGESLTMKPFFLSLARLLSRDLRTCIGVPDQAMESPWTCNGESLAKQWRVLDHAVESLWPWSLSFSA